MPRILRIFLSVILIITVQNVWGDWPRFQGPNQNGISDEKGLARSWPKDGPKVLWAQPVGVGFGGASIKNGKVYLLDREQDQYDMLKCFDFDTGKELWHFTHPVKGRLDHNGSRSVPTIDEKRAYAVGPFGHVYCVDLQSHEMVWQLDLTKEFEAEIPHWGFSQSPLIYQNTLIVAPMSDQAGLVALHKDTGKVIWKSEPIGSGSYVSPVLNTIAGIQGILFFTKRQLSFVNPDNGQLIWKYSGYTCRLPIFS